MNINRDEALRAKDLAEDLMKKAEFTAARKLAMKAQKMDSTLENISRMVMVCDVHCAAIEMFGNERDWYSILQVEKNANDIIIKKQFKKLALLLHPDKNQLPGAESAFKLIGEAQRILLDKDKRNLHDINRKTWRKPARARASAPDKTQHVPNYHTQRSKVNIRPENRHPQQKVPVQPAVFSHPSTFWTSCPSCQTNYEYLREHIMREITCWSCKKQFTALEVPPQSVPLAKSSCQTTFSFPQQNQFPGQKACNEPHKPPDNPATGCSRSESEDVVNNDNMSAQDLESNRGKQPRRSVRSKQQVSYKEKLSGDDIDLVNNNGKRSWKNTDTEMEDLEDKKQTHEAKEQVSYKESIFGDYVDLVNDNGKVSGKNTDIEMEDLEDKEQTHETKEQVSYKENMCGDDVDLVNDNEKLSRTNTDTEMEDVEDEKQTHEDCHLTETLPNSINPKKEIKEKQVKSFVGPSDSKEDLSSGSAEKPNIITYDDPDFNDFDKLRDKRCFKVGQIWALYDDEEGMPRFYALIRKVTTQNFSLKYVWLETEEDGQTRTHNLAVSVGKFELGGEENTNECSVFSHLVCKTRNMRRRKFQVYPKKGETWALFKNWNIDLSSDSGLPKYEYVEILSDHAEGAMVSVRFLSKVKGFSTVFRPMPKKGSNTCQIPPQEFCRFSHSIPSFKLTGTEGRGVRAGWFELDPAALPVTNSQGEEKA